MGSVAIFWMQLLVSCAVFSIVAAWYVWPSVAKLTRNAALIPLLWVHVPRYVGMNLLVTGMVDPKLPNEFLSSAAYGDLLEAVLALTSIFALRSNWRGAVLAVRCSKESFFGSACTCDDARDTILKLPKDVQKTERWEATARKLMTVANTGGDRSDLHLYLTQALRADNMMAPNRPTRKKSEIRT
jgi:hypothetical protein